MNHQHYIFRCIANLRAWVALSALLICHLAVAQSSLWITGSAVPGGTQELEKFPISGSSASCFKFHGKLLPGDLYIVSTAEPSSSRLYYAPKLVDSNIVNEGITWKKTKTEEGSEWAVLFEADNYRFTVDPATNGTVKGELFTWWYEAWICGGCVADNQGVKEGEPGHWQISAGKQMEQSATNPYEWSWTGELKAYTANDEPKRFKINGQYGWSPKVLHPFKQDTPILTATQVCTGGADNKWAIGDDGFYRITVNVFTETIKGEYFGTDPSGVDPITDANCLSPAITIIGTQVLVVSETMQTVSLYAPTGACLDMQTGTSVHLAVPATGMYILHGEGPSGSWSRKIVIKS